MHDPYILAFELKLPFGGSKTVHKDGSVYHHRPVILSIWHVDPETDGSDDSCGWSFPNPPMDAKWVKELQGDFEFLLRRGPEELSAQYADEGQAAWWLLWLNRASFRHRGKGLSSKVVAKVLYQMSFPGDRMPHRYANEPRRLAWMFARYYLQLMRQWWQHPRWHIHHWEVQIPFLNDFKRWAWGRCAGCGKGFRWGYSPITHSWDHEGPQWFKSESDIYHEDCIDKAHKPANVD